MVSVLFAIAELIEAKSLDRARNAIRGLLQLAPEQATVLVGGEWKELPAKQVELEATVRVKPGERIALDGEVTSGRSSVNQAPITGESLPVEKEVGEPVFAGSINGEGALEYRVTRRADDSTLARIIHAVEEAQGSRAPTQRFVDSFARVYTPVVFLIALATAVPPLLFGGAWLDWIYRALVLLVIACPCALVISTPVTIVSGLSAAARTGHPDQGRGVPRTRAQAVLGRPRQDRHHHPWQTATDRATCRSRRLTGRMRACSPPAWPRVPTPGIARRGQRSGRGRPCPGRGREPRCLAGTRRQRTHRRRPLPPRQPSPGGGTGPLLAGPGRALDALERGGKTISRCAIRSACGPCSPSPTGSGQQPRGDPRAARAGREDPDAHRRQPAHRSRHRCQVGIDAARGNLLPEDKLREVEARQADGSRVGMVGDGINDAPALARADIGFAMGAAGTDTAIETAGVALMDDDLRKLPQFCTNSTKPSNT